MKPRFFVTFGLVAVQSFRANHAFLTSQHHRDFTSLFNTKDVRTVKAKAAFVKPKEVFLQILQNAFETAKPFPRGERNDRISVIGEKQMQLAFENYEAFVPPICERICSEEIGGKGIPMFGVVRGSGCGKSRFIEEIRLFMENKREDTLCLAISFNFGFGSPDIEDLWDNPKGSLIYLIIQRMISSYYGITLSECEDILKQFDWEQQLKKAGKQVSSLVRDLLRVTVYHLINKHQQHSSQSLNYFVLAIDESIMPLKAFKTSEDIYSIVRTALLGGPFDEVKPRLIMTSLDYLIFAQSPSGRTIIPVTCGILHEDHVVREIWGKTWNDCAPLALKPLFPLIEPRLRILAASMTQIPRLVEYANTALENFLQENEDFQVSEYKRLVQQMILEVSEAMKYRYETQYDLLKLYPLFFYPTEVKLADKDLKPNLLIMKSIYTNVVDNFLFEPISDSKVSFAPEGSLFRLASQSTKGLFTGLFADMVTLILADDENIGMLLESLSLRWMEARLLVLIAGAKKFPARSSISHLLAVDTKAISNTKLQDIFSENIVLPSDSIDIRFLEDSLESRINKDPSAFFEQLTLPKSQDNGGIIYARKSAPGDCFDFMLVVTLQSTQEPFVIFIDLKSASRLKAKATRTPKDLKQYKTLTAALKLLPDQPPTPILKALKKSQYLYVYLTDWEFDKSVKRDAKSNCYVMDLTETSRLLTMLFPVYRAARVAMNNFEEPLKNEK